MSRVSAVALAGGKGTRLQPMTSNRPKPLIPVANYPMINYSLWCLKQAGIDEIVLAVRYLGDQIREYIGNGEQFGLNIKIPNIDSLDTADAVRKSANLLEEEDFIVTMADLVTNIDLKSFIEFHKQNKGYSTIALKNVPDPLQFGVIMLDEHQKIILTAARAAIVYSRGVAAHLSDLAEDEAKKHGMKFNHINPENMQKFMKLGRAGYRKWAVEEFDLKADFLDEIRNEVAKAGERITDQLVKKYRK